LQNVNSAAYLEVGY